MKDIDIYAFMLHQFDYQVYDQLILLFEELYPLIHKTGYEKFLNASAPVQSSNASSEAKIQFLSDYCELFIENQHRFKEALEIINKSGIYAFQLFIQRVYGELTYLVLINSQPSKTDICKYYSFCNQSHE